MQGYMIEKRESLQQVVLENINTACKLMKLKHSLTPYTKNQSRKSPDTFHILLLKIIYIHKYKTAKVL